MSREDEVADVALDYVAESDRAYLMSNGKREIWIPKSLIRNINEIKAKRGICSTVELPIWFARREGLV